MHDFVRYGIYFVPPEGPLSAFCNSWLGRDLATGKSCAPPKMPDLPKQIRDITATPRKYGFHATLKAPFFLEDDTSPDALDAALSGLCKNLAPAHAEGLRLTSMGDIVVLVAVGDTTAINLLAAEIVRSLDAFRAPATAEELARRRRQTLTDRQDANLVAWGYPYVMDDYHFHMTLTGHLSAEHRTVVAAALSDHLAPILADHPLVIDAVSLVGEDTDGQFHQLHRYALRG